MNDPRSVAAAVQRRWAEAAERSARAVADAQRQFAEAQKAIKERAEQQVKDWTAASREFGRKPDVDVEEIEIRSEEEDERRVGHSSALDRTAQRNRAAADAAEAGDELLLDAFRVGKPPAPKPVEPEPEVAAYLPRSMRDRARRRT